ncbi:MAG: DinB family protein [Armatimonadota bacterium]|nr:DinB family protein [Armatimonadota bacterium]MDR7452148.1 DinB family protein [Armatimonadota bacterium]MDR7467872.1 DinB family protein [Armatimonadota bacterium]MDR7494760.1 DinB family protein [Armatimonadota bacterium]MDR7499585.1 DinB family protein [Armatimonadota bacterium]
MDPLLTPYLEHLDQLHQDIYEAVEPLSDEAINWRHPHLSNSIGVLLRHIAGSERYWIVQTVGGTAVARDREAEFGRERLAKAPLVADLRRAHQEARGVLEGLSASDLSRPLQLSFRGKTRTVTAQWALQQSLQHTAYHLGQIQLFKKMAESR